MENLKKVIEKEVVTEYVGHYKTQIVYVRVDGNFGVGYGFTKIENEGTELTQASLDEARCLDEHLVNLGFKIAWREDFPPKGE